MKYLYLLVILFTFSERTNGQNAPTNVYVSFVSFDRVTINWEYESSNEVGFEIWRSDNLDNHYNLLTSVEVPSVHYIDSSLMENATYYYRVRSYNQVGRSSFYPNEVSITTFSSPSHAPSNLNATEIQYNKVKLSWSDNSDNEDYFTIERSVGNNSSYEIVETVQANDTFYIDNKINPAGEIMYYYRIAASRLHAVPQYCDEISIITPKAPPLPPTFVQNREYGPKSFKIDWIDNADNEVSYRVYISDYESNTPESNVLQYNLPANSTSFFFKEGTPNTYYYVNVVAINENGESTPLFCKVNTSSANLGAWSDNLKIEENQWLPPRSEAVSFSIDNFGYVGLGRNDSGTLNDFWKFDPRDSSWTQLPSFPGSPRIGAVAFSIDGIGYVGTGNDLSDGGFKTDFYAYDPLKNIWYSISDFPKDSASNAGITGGVSFVIDGFGFVGLGNTGLNNTKSFFRYDPMMDNWIKIPDFPGVGRTNAIAYSINSRGRVSFGYDVNHEILSDNWIFENAWFDWYGYTGIYNPGKSEAASAVLNSIGYVFTGILKDEENSSTIKTNSVVRITDLGYMYIGESQLSLPGANRSSAVSFTIGDKAYVGFGLGENNTYLDDLYAFTPKEGFVPKAPENIVAESVDDISIHLSWIDVSLNEDGFVVMAEEMADPSTGFIVLDTLDSNSTFYVHTNLSDTVNYRYKVVAYNIYGKTESISSEFIALGLYNVTIVNARAEAKSPSIVKLDWSLTGEDEIANVELYFSENDTIFTLWGLNNALSNSLLVEGLKSESNYLFLLRAVSPTGKRSPWSDTLSAKTPNGPIAIENLRPAGETTGLATFKWDWQGIGRGNTYFRMLKAIEGNKFKELYFIRTNFLSDDSVENEVLYHYKIRVENLDGVSPFDSISYLRASMPTELGTVSKTYKSVTLKWLDNSNRETGHRVLTWYNDRVINIDTIGANITEYEVKGLVGNTNYGFSVESLGINSRNSSQLYKDFTLPPPPDAPSNLILEEKTQQMVTLSWADNSNDEAGFRIFRLKEGLTDYSEIGVVSTNVTQFTDAQASPDTLHIYRLVAFSANGSSDYAEAQILIDLLSPEAPTNLSYGRISQTEARLTWIDNSMFESGFEILKGISGTELNPIATVNANVKEFVDGDLYEEAFSYRVRAINKAGVSEMSNEVSLSVLGIDDILAERLTIYPSPIKNELNISLPSGTYDLRVINSKGIEILQMPLEGSETIDCSNWSSGVYLLYISNGDGQMVQKVFKE